MVGTILSVLGPALIAAVGVAVMTVGTVRFDGVRRWLVLVVGPLVIAGSAFLLLSVLGNSRSSEGAGFLVGVLTELVLLRMLPWYYGILLIAAVVLLVKRHREDARRRETMARRPAID